MRWSINWLRSSPPNEEGDIFSCAQSAATKTNYWLVALNSPPYILSFTCFFLLSYQTGYFPLLWIPAITYPSMQPSFSITKMLTLELWQHLLIDLKNNFTSLAQFFSWCYICARKSSQELPLSSSFSYKYLPSILVYPKGYKTPAEVELINFLPQSLPAQLLPLFLDLKTFKAEGITLLCV